MNFYRIPDFNPRSYRGADFFTRLLKQPDDGFHQAHEVDEFILRGPEIVFDDGRGPRSLGFADFKPSVLRQIAVDELDMMPSAAVRRVSEQLADSQAREAELRSALDEARNSLMRALIELNDVRDERNHLDADLQFANGRLAAAAEQAAAVPATPKPAAKRARA